MPFRAPLEPTSSEAVSRREARAALALLDAQCPAEGLRLARPALRALRPTLPAGDVLLVDRFLDRPEPVRDREVAPGDLHAARDALVAILERGPEVRRAQLRVLGGLVVAVVLLALAAVLRPAPPITARASAVYADLPGFGPDMAIDGDPTTSWLLPNETAGSLVLEFDAPRTVTEVVLRSTRNTPYDDRAIEEFVVQAANGDEILAEVSGRFTWAQRDEPRTVPLQAIGANRVRVRIISWHRIGGGIAELEVR